MEDSSALEQVSWLTQQREYSASNTGVKFPTENTKYACMQKLAVVSKDLSLLVG